MLEHQIPRRMINGASRDKAAPSAPVVVVDVEHHRIANVNRGARRRRWPDLREHRHPTSNRRLEWVAIVDAVGNHIVAYVLFSLKKTAHGAAWPPPAEQKLAHCDLL